VSRKEAEDWARSKGMLFVESSAKTRIGIQQVFNEVVQKVSSVLYAGIIMVNTHSSTCSCVDSSRF
jgi:hypothetical protein